MTHEPTAEIRVPGRLPAGGRATGVPGRARTDAPGAATGTPPVVTGAPGVTTGAPGGSTDAPGTTTGTPAGASGTPGAATGTSGEASGTPGAAPGTSGEASGTPGAATGTSGEAGSGDRDPAATADAPATPLVSTPAGRRRRWLVALLLVLLTAALGAAGYLYATTRAYAERLQWTEEQARTIGADLTLTRSELDGARAEIAALQSQLTTAQERITALADEKAQIGDDREAQRQLLDYQARVSQAAGTVALALDRCVQGQDQLITYLEDAESYDPAQLSRFGSDVEALCQSASDANDALQSELVER